MEDELPVSELETDVHTALKGWSQPSPSMGPLDHLQLVQQALLAGDMNIRQATNKVLLVALEALAENYSTEAILLRRRFLDRLMMNAVANQLNMSEATAYRRQQIAIRQLTLVLQELEDQAREAYQTDLEKRLRLPPQVSLVGIDPSLQQLQAVLTPEKDPWLVSIEGLGGIGKTALANALVRLREVARHFYDIAWISARQQKLPANLSLQPSSGAIITGDTLVDSLLEQFGQLSALSQLPSQKKVILTRLLKQRPYLVVIDNLETVADYLSLLPLLRQMANPTKFLLTSRYSLRTQTDVFCYTVQTLGLAEMLHFIRQEAGSRGLMVVVEASDADLERIYKVVGGHPLALKLVVGQLASLPLSTVINRLQQAQGKNIEELYTFIYWDVWNLLEPVAQQALLVMPLVEEGTLEQLLALSRLDSDQLNQALEQLINLSLVQAGGDLDNRRYSIHRLTETFLLNEALKWHLSGEADPPASSN
jgi:hypothetical protein